ncbi:hypothetical protein HPB50_005120 [Hyalomma asiaticum]|uniref:Uncharacterized protein n=1 Tax=Hyalomma asiaticum TaxID=266040 RepID=A0ACB7TB79_HYAAI|nr:hypothetical protein HPB50_005120 [Hyalomma asiaticum]
MARREQIRRRGPPRIKKGLLRRDACPSNERQPWWGPRLPKVTREWERGPVPVPGRPPERDRVAAADRGKTAHTAGRRSLASAGPRRRPPRVAAAAREARRERQRPPPSPPSLSLQLFLSLACTDRDTSAGPDTTLETGLTPAKLYPFEARSF